MVVLGLHGATSFKPIPLQGIVIRVNGFEEKTFLDKDLLNLELSGELYPLDALCRMTMRKESDDVVMNVPWILDLNFDFEEGETVLSFSFEQERHRLQFALMLRILRTRNPHLNLAGTPLAKAHERKSNQQSRCRKHLKLDHCIAWHKSALYMSVPSRATVMQV